MTRRESGSELFSRALRKRFGLSSTPRDPPDPSPACALRQVVTRLAFLGASFGDPPDGCVIPFVPCSVSFTGAAPDPGRGTSRNGGLRLSEAPRKSRLRLRDRGLYFHRDLVRPHVEGYRTNGTPNSKALPILRRQFHLPSWDPQLYG